ASEQTVGDDHTRYRGRIIGWLRPNKSHIVDVDIRTLKNADEGLAVSQTHGNQARQPVAADLDVAGARNFDCPPYEVFPRCETDFSTSQLNLIYCRLNSKRPTVVRIGTDANGAVAAFVHVRRPGNAAARGGASRQGDEPQPRVVV